MAERLTKQQLERLAPGFGITKKRGSYYLILPGPCILASWMDDLDSAVSRTRSFGYTIVPAQEVDIPGETFEPGEFLIIENRRPFEELKIRIFVTTQELENTRKKFHHDEMVLAKKSLTGEVLYG